MHTGVEILSVLPGVRKVLRVERENEMSLEDEAAILINIREHIVKEKPWLASHIPMVEYFSKSVIKMERAPGNTLFKVFANCTLDQLMQLIINVCEIVEAIHNGGFVHDDISTYNIVF